MVTFNILKLNGASQNMSITKCRKTSSKESKSISTFRNQGQEKKNKKTQRRREATYSGNKIGEYSGTARGVNLKLKKGQRGQELREDYQILDVKLKNFLQLMDIRSQVLITLLSKEKEMTLIMAQSFTIHCLNANFFMLYYTFHK